MTHLRCSSHVMQLLLGVTIALNARNLYSQEAAVAMQLVCQDPVPEREKRLIPPGIGFCVGREINGFHVEVDKASRGIQDIVLIADLKEPEYATSPKSSPETHKIVIERCNFVKQVLLIQSGDTVSFENKDPVPFDIYLNAFKNESVRLVVPPNDRVDHKFTNAELAFVHVDSGERPWMAMRIYVLSHRFAGVSDVTGKVEIHNLPEKAVKFKLWHPLATSVYGIRRVIREGDQDFEVIFPFEMDLGKGVSDLGVVAVPLSQFRLPSH